MKKVEFTNVEKDEYSEGMKYILDLYSIEEKDSYYEDEMERMKVSESMDILQNHGQYFEVKKGKIDRRSQKLGSCYKNSFKMMDKGYKYVEGIVHHKLEGRLISHAWNVDENGNHFDFTYDNPEDLKYIGIVLEEKLVYKVGLNNGGIFYCVLPFVKVK